MLDTLHFSRHASVRIAQRGISVEDVDYVLDHGRRLWVHQAQAYFLGWRDIPKQDRSTHCHLEGTLVLLDDRDSAVITAYRNRQALKLLRRKQSDKSMVRRRTFAPLLPTHDLLPEVLA